MVPLKPRLIGVFVIDLVNQPCNVMDLTIFWEHFLEKNGWGKSDPRCRDHKNYELDILPTHQNEKLMLEDFFPEILSLGHDNFWKINKSREEAKVKISQF